jgi:predicted Rossmann fold nucleotide-binding protein DprA/Smf involved in DNA uptake
MSEDAKAILLLCGRFGDRDDSAPLELRDYNKVVQWLVGKNLRPADLFDGAAISALAAEVGLPQSRLSALMARGVQMGFAVEAWSQIGIWLVSRSDPDYPSRYKARLKDKAPPILFCVGDKSLLAGGGVAMVGSRNVDAEGDDFARQVAAWCATHHVPVVSGGARGVDQTSMSAALETGGLVIGILADSLRKRSVSRDVRNALADGKVLLVSPYYPDAGFSVGNAMGRNKLIYAMADHGLVVSAEYNKGGTWAGATEELKRTDPLPIFVRTSGRVPNGNAKLVQLGAIPFPSYHFSDNPLSVLEKASSCAKAPAPLQKELSLFDHSNI